MAGLLISCDLSAEITSIRLQSSDNTGEVSTVPLPEPVFAQQLSTLSFGLSKIDFGDFLIYDSAFIALARSQAAKSLRSLSIDVSRLTGDVADFWVSLKALRELEIDSRLFFPIPGKLVSGICSHRKLRKLHIRDPLADLSTLLAPDSLPRVRYLITSAKIRSRKLRSLLLARENCHLLKEISADISISSSDRGKGCLDVHHLCPRLRQLLRASYRDHTFVDLERAVAQAGSLDLALENLRNLTALSVPTLAKLSDSKLESWAQAFPRVEQLQVSFDVSGQPFPSGPLNFDVFGRLRTLDLFISTVAGHKMPPNMRFPAQLKSLIFCVRPDPTPPDEVDAMLDALVCCAPRVTEIHLFFGSASLQRRHLEKCLSSFENLQVLRLFNPEQDPAAQEVLRVIHPCLKELPSVLIHGLLRVVPGWLPAIRDLAGLDALLDLAALPNLTRVAIQAFGDELPAPVLRTVAEAACGNLFAGTKKLPAILSVRLLFHGAAAEIDHRVLCSMVKLRKLSVIWALCFAGKHFAQILRALPLLESIDAAVFLSKVDLSWLRHSKLSVVNLALRSHISEDTVESLNLTPETFPALRAAFFEIPRFMSVNAAGLQALDKLEMCGVAVEPLSIPFRVHDCPRLDELWLVSLSFQKVELVNLTRLRQVSFTKCSLTNKAKNRVEACPRVAKLSLFPHQEEEKHWKTFQALVLKQIPAPDECVVVSRVV